MDYKYINLNPYGEKDNDCVCRAISLALNENYFDIKDKLYYISKLFNCEELCVCCYKHLLNNVYGLPKVYCRNMTANDFSNEHPYGVYILRMDGHCSCAIDNCLFDIWDCRDEILTDVWQVV